MTKTPESALLAALRGVIDPDSGRDVLSAGMIAPGAVRLHQGRAVAMLEVGGAADAARAESVRAAAEAALAAVPGVSRAVVGLAGTRAAAPETIVPAPAAPPPAAARLAPAARIVAVASGKGGVGKSTVAANLAVALARMGRRVGLLDADIYGPSAPILFGLSAYRPKMRADKKIPPAHSHGVAVMSIGFMVEDGAPVVWRGPMVQSGIVQMLRDTDWGALDILIVDMPPGTGDAQMAVAQKSALSGAVVVTTPQAVAVADARKGLEGFRRMGVPILGVVENMSAFVCPCCGTRSALFGAGGGQAEAARAGVPFLGAIPVTPDLCALSDAGTPIVAAQPDSPAAQAFVRIAAALAAEGVSAGGAGS